MANAIPSASNKDLAEAFHAAARLHLSGNIAKAELQYQEILKADPLHFGALRLLGVLLGQQGRFELALEIIRQALVLKPYSAEAHNSLGDIHAMKQKYDEAITSYQAAHKINPRFIDPISKLARLFTGIERHSDAIPYYRKLIALSCDDSTLHRTSVERLAISEKSRLQSSKDEKSAIEPFDVVYSLGDLLQKKQQHQEAIQYFKKAITLKPDFAEPYISAATSMRKEGMLESALEQCALAIEIRPDSADVHLCMASILVKLHRPAEALTHCDIARSLEADSAELSARTASALTRLGRHAEALSQFNKAIEISPDNAGYRFNRAFTNLLLGDHEKGWRDYEARLTYKKAKNAHPVISGPQLERLDMARGKCVLLFHEQGLGDTLQFIRYLPLLTAIAEEVIVLIQEPLKRLLKNNVAANVVLLTSEEFFATPLTYDFQCALMSLPLFFGTTTETIPSRISYLQADPRKISEWKTRINHDRKFVVGLAWTGNPLHNNDFNRSMSLTQLAPLLALPNITFISLQKENRQADAELMNNVNIRDYGADLSDFDDTAALIANTDLVISVDTSIAHLTGALGKPLWLLLPFVPDWRWLTERLDSPWYPSATLFRQSAIGEWSPVVQSVVSALSQYSQKPV